MYFVSLEDLTLNVMGSAGGASEGEDGRSAAVSLDDISLLFGWLCLVSSFAGFAKADCRDKERSCA